MPASLLITTPASALGLLLGSGAVAAVFSPGRVGLQRWQMTALLVLLLVQSGIHLAAALDSSVSLAPAQWETPMSMSTLAALALVLLCAQYIIKYKQYGRGFAHSNFLDCTLHLINYLLHVLFLEVIEHLILG